MRILGKSRNGGVIAELNRSELGLITDGKNGNDLEVGQDVDFWAGFDNFRRLQRNRDKLQETAKLFRGLADMCEGLNPIIVQNLDAKDEKQRATDEEDEV